MDYLNWNRGLVLAAILIVIGGMAVISSRSSRDRLFAVGLLIQGIVVLFAVSGAFHRRSELAAVAIALILISGLWYLWDRDLCDVSLSDSLLSSANRGLGGTHPSTPDCDPHAPQNKLSEGA